MKKLNQKEIDFIVDLMKDTAKKRQFTGTVSFKLTGVPNEKIQGESWEVKVSYSKNMDVIIGTIVNFKLESSEIEIPEEFLKSYEI